MPNTLIYIGQSETGRFNFQKTPDINLITAYIHHSVIVVFSDTHGNCSLTQVSINTNLEFLKTEAKAMQGPYTVDIIKHANSTSSLAEDLILPYAKEELGSFQNSKGNQEIRTTKTGLVLFKNRKLLTPTMLHLEQISAANAHLKSKIPKENSIRDDILDEGSVSIQKRVYLTHFNDMLEPSKQLPTLVYDSGWTGNVTTLTPTAKKLILEYREDPKHEKVTTHALKNMKVKTLHNLQLTSNIPSYIRRYLNFSLKEEVNNILTFAYQSSPPLLTKKEGQPSAAIQISNTICEYIGEYLEDSAVKNSSKKHKTKI